MFKSNYTRSGTIILIIEIQNEKDYDDIDFSITKVSVESENALKDAAWLESLVSDCGIKDLFFYDELPIKNGEAYITGYCYSERTDSIDWGTDYDGGFEIESISFADLECDECDGSGTYYIDDKPVKCICSEPQE